MAAAGVDVALRPIWSVPAAASPVGDASSAAQLAATSPEGSLCYHPLVSGSSVLVVTGDTIDDVHGYDLDTGRPLWLETSLPPDAVAARRRPAVGGASRPADNWGFRSTR